MLCHVPDIMWAEKYLHDIIYPSKSLSYIMRLLIAGTLLTGLFSIFLLADLELECVSRLFISILISWGGHTYHLRSRHLSSIKKENRPIDNSYK